MKFASFFRNLAGLAEACTLYTAAGATSGGGAALIALAYSGRTDLAAAAGMAGFFLPTFPLYLWFTSDRAMEATFARLEKWKQQKYITADQAKELKAAALLWYRRRMFGPAPEPPTPLLHNHNGPEGSAQPPPNADSSV